MLIVDMSMNGILIMGRYDRQRNKRIERDINRKAREYVPFCPRTNLPGDNRVDPISSATFGMVDGYGCLTVEGSGALKTTLYEQSVPVGQILDAPGCYRVYVQKSKRSKVAPILRRLC